MSVDPDSVWAVACNRRKGKETFTILFVNGDFHSGRILFFETEEKLRAELELMGQSDAMKDTLIARARQHADQQAA